MLSIHHIFDTIDMIDKRHLDIRTITMGISLLDCVSEDPKRCCEKIYDKICRRAQHLVRTGEEIQGEFGIPIVNKRISVTPMALVAGGCDTEDYVPFAHAMDRAAKTCGVDFIGGYSALVQKGFAHGDELLLRAIPQALAETDIVCSSINVGSTKAGINMDAVARMGRIIKETAHLTRDTDGLGCAKLVVFCNAVEDNPFMAGAFHGVGEADSVINVGVSGPGVVYHALQSVKGQPFDVVAETIKRPPSASPAWASWWPRKPAAAWTPPSASWTFPWPPPPLWGTAWPASWRRWGWRCAAPTAPPPPWLCSTTR